MLIVRQSPCVTSSHVSVCFSFLIITKWIPGPLRFTRFPHRLHRRRCGGYLQRMYPRADDALRELRKAQRREKARNKPQRFVPLHVPVLGIGIKELKEIRQKVPLHLHIQRACSNLSHQPVQHDTEEPHDKIRHHELPEPLPQRRTCPGLPLPHNPVCQPGQKKEAGNTCHGREVHDRPPADHMPCDNKPDCDCLSIIDCVNSFSHLLECSFICNGHDSYEK